MLIRHALWQMRKEAGDGCATMALLYQTLLREGIRYIAQDCNPMLLRASLERGRDAITAWLRQHARPLAGREAITGVAKSMCQGDIALSEMFGEIFDIVGPDGLIVVEGWEENRPRTRIRARHLLETQRLALALIRLRSRYQASGLR